MALTRSDAVGFWLCAPCSPHSAGVKLATTMPETQRSVVTSMKLRQDRFYAMTPLPPRARSILRAEHVSLMVRGEK